jgi:hypothetical protein
VSTGFTIRSYRRYPVQYAVEYRSPHCVGKGLVRNLSRSGWRIEGDHAVAPGTMLTLAVSFPGDSLPVTGQGARLRHPNHRDAASRRGAIRTILNAS